jgi:hypothetical protein
MKSRQENFPCKRWAFLPHRILRHDVAVAAASVAPNGDRANIPRVSKQG